MLLYVKNNFLLFLLVLLSACGSVPEDIGMKYNVLYDGNGYTSGSVPQDDNQYYEGSSVSVMGRDSLAKMGYIFVCWNSEENGDGVSYYEGDTLQISSQNITLYALWEKTYDADFTIAMLPDTQTTVGFYNHVLVSQIDWLINNKETYNISFVGHLGDLVQDYDSDLTEWAFIRTQMDRLIAADIPYSVLPGNHDYKYKTRDSTMYNNYFPLSHLSTFSTFAGSYDTTSDNTYYLLDIGSEEILILSLEFGPRDEVIVWADAILGVYSDLKAIVITHAYLRPNDTYIDSSYTYAASNNAVYGFGLNVNDGIDLWNKLIYPNSNIRLVVCGHDAVPGDGAGLKISSHADNSPVYEILSNYQGFPVSDSGYILLLQFSPQGGIVNMETYSPYCSSYKTTYDTEASFSF